MQLSFYIFCPDIWKQFKHLNVFNNIISLSVVPIVFVYLVTLFCVAADIQYKHTCMAGPTVWKHCPIDHCMSSLKTGGLWWQTQLHWNSGPSSRKMWSFNTGGSSQELSFQPGYTTLHIIQLLLHITDNDQWWEVYPAWDMLLRVRADLPTLTAMTTGQQLCLSACLQSTRWWEIFWLAATQHRIPGLLANWDQAP